MLSDLVVRRAKAGPKPYRLADSGGLALFVSAAGSKSWQLRHRVEGREQIETLGRYPEMSLLEARIAQDAFKKARRLGTVQVVEAARSFEDVAREWHRVQAPRWAERHARKTLESLVADAFPAFGSDPIDRIKPPAVLKMIRQIEARDAPEHARKVLQRVSAVFVYAIASGIAESDPASTIRRALAPQVKGRQPAIVDLRDAVAALVKVDALPARPVTRLAMRMLALTGLRQGELRGANWTEFEGLDGKVPVWRVPASRMKMKREHVVPLSRQAVETLAALRTLTGSGPMPFPSTSNAHKPMSENALGFLLSRAGYQKLHVPHGWRASFSTIMNERYPADRLIIDLMLAHKPKDAVEGAYNRAEHMDRRRELAQVWADLITKDLAPPAALLDLPRR
jgi:integrase